MSVLPTVNASGTKVGEGACLLIDDEERDREVSNATVERRYRSEEAVTRETNGMKITDVRDAMTNNEIVLWKGEGYGGKDKSLWWCVSVRRCYGKIKGVSEIIKGQQVSTMAEMLSASITEQQQ